jgi:hypothetical protein
MLLTEFLEILAPLILGWLLGLLSPGIVDWIKEKKEVKKIKTALFSELQELEYRLVLVVYKIESKHGNINKKFFQWAQGVLSNNKGVNDSDSLMKTLGILLNLSDEEIKASVLITKERDKSGNGLGLKKLSLAFLDASLPLLSKFDPILLGNLLEIKTHIGFINELVDDSHYYFRLSFQNDISTTNYQIADTNMVNSYRDYQTQVRVVIDTIEKILPKTNNT